MAEIRFQLLMLPAGTPIRDNLQGSGLAFYGSTAASSVQVGEYQDSTYVSNSDGSTYTDLCNNSKYVASVFPSGRAVLKHDSATDSVGLSGVKTYQSTIGIEFGHTTAVKVQNAQLRIYDRSNINNPASGVNTKVAEIVNHNGYAGSTAWANQGTIGKTSNVVGSGDILWWGEPWPAEMVGAYNYYTNSNGVIFTNGTDADTNINGDSRLSTAAVAGSYDTVGGTGIILPLLDSPGSGQQGLQTALITDASDATPGLMWPKWTQYVNTTARQALFFTDGDPVLDFNNASLASNGKTFGGTGIYTHHTWAVSLSASPLSVGAKDQYGLYISLEYL